MTNETQILKGENLQSPFLPSRSALAKHGRDLGYPILLFDGICNYCNRWVNFIIRHDKKKKFRFAALQSEAGKKILKQYSLSEKEESAILIYNEKVYLKSSTGLHVLYHLGGIYSLAFVFIIVPAYIRDFYYDIIARNRYKWWGKRNECMIPTDDVKERFLSPT